MPIGAVAVIGAGPQGSRIAAALARGGISVILEDILPGSLRRAEDEIRTLLEDHAHAALARVRFAGSVEDAARSADIVIEAVPDELESKLEIFTLLDKVCRPETVLVTTSRATSVSELASVTYRPARCGGLRLGNDVEVVLTAQTDRRTSSLLAELASATGKPGRTIREG